MDRTAENVSERNSEEVSHLDGCTDNSTEITHMAEVVPPDALTVALAELPPSLALKVRDSYAHEFQRVAELEKQARALVVTDESQTVEMKMAGVLRCHLVKLRTGIDKKRKGQNEDARAWTLANNGAANAVIGVIALLESHLRDQETFGERRAAERRAELHASRTAQLVALGVDPNTYRFENASDQAFADVLADVRALQAAKAEAARLAEVAKAEEAQRIATAQEAERAEKARQDAERLERERVTAEENARLKAEAEAHDQIVRAEREAAAEVLRREREERDAAEARFAAEREAERQAAEHAAAIAAEALRIEREAAAAIAKAEREERDRERQRAEAQARIEREKIEEQARKAQAENEALLRRIADAERVEREKAEALAEEQRQKALAPDREKLLAYAEALAAVPQPVLATTAGLSALGKIVEQVTKLVAGIRRLAGGL